MIERQFKSCLFLFFEKRGEVAFEIECKTKGFL